MNSKRKKGFTIVELVVVMAIIAILILIAVPQYTKYIQDANDTKYTLEGTEIYTAITEGIEQLAIQGEDPYDVDRLLPIVNESMRNNSVDRSRNDSSDGSSIVINNGTDTLLDLGDNQTWGLVIDEENQTITHNNQVDSEHNYVFVNGIFVGDEVPPIDNGGDDGGDDGGDNGGDDGGNDGGNDDPSSGNDDMDTGALDVYEAVVQARQIIKDSGRDCYQPFQITEITNQIANSHLLDSSVRIFSGYDNDSGNNTWGLTVEETGKKEDYNLDDDIITLTNRSEDGYTYTYVNGIFVKKE